MRVALLWLAGLVFAASAGASIGFTGVSPSSAAPGQMVTLEVAGYLGPRPWPALPVVLVARSDELRLFRCGPNVSCASTLLPAALDRSPFYPIGAISRWQTTSGVDAVAGTGRLIFRVPRLKAGIYVPMVVCDACVPGPRVSLISTAGVAVRVR